MKPNKAIIIMLALIFPVLLILIIRETNSVYAQSNTPTPITTVIASQTNQDQIETKNAILTAQYDLMRQYDQRLLNTVYWSLSVVGALVVGLTALNWYTNNRLYERDKAIYQKELEGFINVELGKSEVSIRNELGNRFNTLSKELEEIH